MELKVEGIIIIMIGSILLAALLPTALNSLYDTNSNTFRFSSHNSLDSSSKLIPRDLNVTQDTATAAMWNLLPLMGVLAGLGLLAAVGIKEYMK